MDDDDGGGDGGDVPERSGPDSGSSSSGVSDVVHPVCKNKTETGFGSVFCLDHYLQRHSAGRLGGYGGGGSRPLLPLLGLEQSFAIGCYDLSLRLIGVDHDL